MGPADVTHTLELLFFEGCANRAAAKTMLEEAIDVVAPGTPIREIDATDAATAARLRFPGSPTIRVDRRRRAGLRRSRRLRASLPALSPAPGAARTARAR